jgi:hypothetical protein
MKSSSDSLRQHLREALEEIPTIDPHCHLDPRHPAAATLADLMLYHHVWIELVSAGMDPGLVTRAGLPHELRSPEMDPLERVHLAAPYLPRIANTAVGVMLRRLLSDLYGFSGPLEGEGLDALAAEVVSQGSAPARHEHVLRERCNVQQCVSVEGEESGMVRSASEALRWLTPADPKVSPAQRIVAMESVGGFEIRSAADYERFARSLVRRNVSARTVFLGAWLPPCLDSSHATPREVTAALEDARRGVTLDSAQIGGVTYFGLRAAVDELRSTPLRTLQVIVGAEVLPPHRSITAWHPDFCGAPWHPDFCGALARIADQFAEMHFSVSTASEMFIHDTAVMAKHVPNISVAGYWWHTLYPYTIRKSLELRLDAVPAQKIVAFFSDAYHCEWCYPKLLMVKQILLDILAERVDRGWYDLVTAVGIGRSLLHDAPAEIYGLGR